MTTSVQPIFISIHPDGFEPGSPAKKHDGHFDGCTVRPASPPPGRCAAPDSFYTIPPRGISRARPCTGAGLAAGADGPGPSSYGDEIRFDFSG